MTALRDSLRRRWTALKASLRELHALNFAMLALAGCVNAFGVTLFLFPVKLYDSGISGLSMLLDQVTPPYLTLPLFLAALNVPVFAFGLKRQGAAFTVYSLFAVCCYSLMSYLIMNVLPINVNFISPLAGRDLLLCAVFGGAISGVGSGLTIRFGGAIDGVDVLSVVFAKKIGISIGSFVMCFNALLYIVCGFVIKSWILPLYSIVTYFVGSKTVDFIVEGFDRSVCAMIITDKAEKVSAGLSERFKAGGTIVNATGGYSKESKQIIYFIVNHFQINNLKNTVFGIDANAFISLQDVSDIFKKTKE
jgi:uncharacterized membrane-anchored protein YitT (DUF2179 family)